MAIKIIKEGKKEFITKCSYCGCEFSYDITDLRKSPISREQMIECPYCKQTHYHNEGDAKND